MEKFIKGKIMKCVVTGIEPYGIFVKFDDYYSGLIHISEISKGFVRNPGNFVKIGEIINVEILDVDNENGQLKLSIKNIDYKMHHNIKRKKIKETSLGFKTLSYKLPYWIEENLKNHEKVPNSIDK